MTWDFRDRMIGLLGHRQSSFLMAWLASHRGRLSTLILGGHRFSLALFYDNAGSKQVSRSKADEHAIYQLTYGEPWPKTKEEKEQELVEVVIIPTVFIPTNGAGTVTLSAYVKVGGVNFLKLDPATLIPGQSFTVQLPSPLVTIT